MYYIPSFITDVIDVNTKTMTLYDLTGRWSCSAVSRKTACKYFIASIFSAYIRLFIEVFIETNVNLSNEIIFSAVDRSVNYIGWLAKLT